MGQAPKADPGADVTPGRCVSIRQHPCKSSRRLRRVVQTWRIRGRLTTATFELRDRE